MVLCRIPPGADPVSKRPVTPLALAVPASKGAAYVPEPAVQDAARVVVSSEVPALAPVAPAAMNFKLSTDASTALRVHQFKTGRTKQAIVEEALNQWLERYRHLIE